MVPEIEQAGEINNDEMEGLEEVVEEPVEVRGEVEDSSEEALANEEPNESEAKQAESIEADVEQVDMEVDKVENDEAQNEEKEKSEDEPADQPNIYNEDEEEPHEEVKEPVLYPYLSETIADKRHD